MTLWQHGRRKRSGLVPAGITLTALTVAAIAFAENWTRIAVVSAPAKVAATSRGDAAIAADLVFWKVFHGGSYDAIQPALDALTAAYLKTPNDAVTAAHIGWLHTWRIAERARLANPPATITDDLALSHKFFQEAVSLDPSDARYLGFLATQILAEAKIDQNERHTREGYFVLLDSVKAWPEFNLFTAGYVMSDAPVDSARFKEGLDDQWRNMDVCVDEKVNRANPDYSKYMSLDTKTGRKRACWNSQIAPHNLEGFFLNMGDMLVKTGDVKTAVAIYKNAKVPKEYATWKLRDVLDDRIVHANENAVVFNHQDATATPIMLNSSFACMACHQE